jgi:ligand-binding sensor domain-containing protein/signal transduction histidine kinase
MTAAPTRRGRRPDPPPWGLALIVLVVACGALRAAAQAKGPGSAPAVPFATEPPLRDLRFSHLTTRDGLSQGYVTAIVQDRSGFMWLATRDGLNRYDGNAFVVYKHNPNDPGSLSSNFIQDLLEDDQGCLWIGTNNGLNRFDPRSERVTRYVHDSKNPDTLGGSYVQTIAQDDQGHIWLGLVEAGLDKFDPRTGRFTHYRNDIDGQFVGTITHVIAGRHRDIWFVSDRGLFQLDEQAGRIMRPAGMPKRLSADSVYQGDSGDLWLLTQSPIVGLVKYEAQAKQFREFPLSAASGGALASGINGGSLGGKLVADGQNGLWVPSSQGLYYFDRRTGRFAYRFQHDESNRDSLNTNAIMSVFRDRSGVLWVGTENAGVDTLNFRQEQFIHYKHRVQEPDSLSPGRVKAIHQDPNGVLWVGLFPRALDRLEPKTGHIGHYTADPDTLGPGTNVDSLYTDTAGNLWIGGGGSGVARLDPRSGRFAHYRHDPADSSSLISDNVYTIYGDRHGHVWVGSQYGLSRFEPDSNTFINYRPVPDDPTSLRNHVWTIYQDQSGALRLGTFGGALIDFDEETKAFTVHAPDARAPHSLNGGGITTLHEDGSGTLWLGGFDGLYRYDRQSGRFNRYTEINGLPSSTIRCIQEDRSGRLWLSTQKGVSRFDPKLETFRNYDITDGLQSDEFSDGCYQSSDGQIFFGGSNGFNAFYPDQVRDDPYVPPVAITSFKVFNKALPIGGEVLKQSIPYVDSLMLPYRDNVFSLEFAALSYANSHRNRYRYRLENFDASWTEVGSQQRLATYTNLDPGRYVFRVQGSNSDGLWNEAGVALSVLITPPWYRTNSFRAACVALLLALLGAAYQYRIRQMQHAFSTTLEARVGERTRIARELHDTLLQGFHGLLLRFQTASYLLPDRPAEAKERLDGAIALAAQAITEGRDAVQGLRASTVERNDLPVAIRTVGDELAADASANPSPAFRVGVEGQPRDLHPILRDEIYKIAAEALRNAFRHGQAGLVEVDIRYDDDEFRLRVRDDGKGIDPEVLAAQGIEGHYGLRGMPERAAVIGGTLTVWSKVGEGTEVELRLPAGAIYAASRRPSWMARILASATSPRHGE